jgi:hypothetical protein
VEQNSEQRLGNIKATSCQYQSNVLAISKQHLGNIKAMSWQYQSNVLAISKQHLIKNTYYVY